MSKYVRIFSAARMPQLSKKTDATVPLGPETIWIKGRNIFLLVFSVFLHSKTYFLHILTNKSWKQASQIRDKIFYQGYSFHLFFPFSQVFLIFTSLILNSFSKKIMFVFYLWKFLLWWDNMFYMTTTDVVMLEDCAISEKSDRMKTKWKNVKKFLNVNQNMLEAEDYCEAWPKSLLIRRKLWTFLK